MRESHIKKAGGHYIKTKLKEKYQKNNFFSLHNIKKTLTYFFTPSRQPFFWGEPLFIFEKE
jgi:hypothetical protein